MEASGSIAVEPRSTTAKLKRRRDWPLIVLLGSGMFAFYGALGFAVYRLFSHMF